MSGFLQHLAAQALGNRKTLRSAVRQPYASVPFTEYSAQIDSPVTSPAVARAERAPTQDSTPAVQPVAAQTVARSAPAATSTAQAHETTVILPSPEVLVDAVATVNAAQVEQTKRPATPANMSTRQPDKDTTPPAAQTPASATEEIEVQVLLNDSENRITRSHTQQATPDTRAAPPPLLPLRNAARPAAMPAAAPMTRGANGNHTRHSPVEETTEVHVSIGRIEVTAVHEPAPRPRPAPAQPKPMTLDEYFARRQEKR